MTEQAFLAEFAIPINPKTRRILALLGGLGSHNLSAIREIISVSPICDRCLNNLLYGPHSYSMIISV
jgi:hypothetical protein